MKQGKANAVSDKLRKTVMTGVGLCLVTVVLSGCIGPVKPAAQTREEALAYFEGEPSMFTTKQSYTSTLRYADVVRKAERLSEKCLNFDTRVVNRGVGPSASPTGTWSYRSTVVSVSPSRTELTMRRIDPEGLTPANHMPKGGYFYILVNYTKNKQGKADVVVYGPSMGSDEIMDALKDWTQGSSAKCPVEFDS